MADTRFYNRQGPFKIDEIVAITGGELRNVDDPERVICDVAPLESAGKEDLSFLANIAYKEQFGKTRAGLCIVPPKLADMAPPNTALILTDDPHNAYALAAAAFYPDELGSTRPGNISDKAYIAESAEISEGCNIEAGVVIKAGAKIGGGTWIAANSVIGENVEIGENTRIDSCATISHALIGNNVHIYAGCRIGQDGFGFAMSSQGFRKVPQLGRVIIGDGVQIGANSTVDRGSGPDTVIGEGTWVDNLVQIGHNVHIGKGCVLVSQVGISGSTVVEDYVVFAGQAGIAGHLRIGKGARIGAKSGVMRDVPAGEEYMGLPAMPARQFMKQVAMLKKMLKNK